ncbi:MAG: glycosyltransferase family 4 protein [Candidatus Omnitrophica bacterium]|nr:glycosyltransferase family 4 protein [Candidatus Omnitrophota bacterium]
MKIGILTQYYPPEIGAPQARFSVLVERLLKDGHKVFVLTAMPSYPKGRIYPGYGGLFRREEEKGAVVLRTYIHPTRRLSVLSRLSNYSSFAFSSLVAGAFCLPRLDYLITESPPLPLALSGFLLSCLKGARWIFNVSDLWPESFVRLGLIEDGWLLHAMCLLESFSYKKAWLLTGQSKEILEHAKRRIPGISAYHFSNSVDTGKFAPELRTQDIRDSIAKGRGCIALYAGLHGFAQGLDQILKAAARLKDLNDLCIVFAGEGPDKKRLVEMAGSEGISNVRFVDARPHDDMPALLASADIAVITLKTKLPGAVPSKIYEAMASGVPIVLAASGEAADIIKEAKCGISVPPQDTEALAAGLRELAGDAARRKELGANGRRSAESRFDRRVICDKFIDYLQYRKI